MALLKDVRLLLIIGTAILCLMALKMCSTEYPADVSSADGVATDAKTVVGDAGKGASESDQKSEESEADSAIAKVAVVATEEAAPEQVEQEQVATEQVVTPEKADVEVADAAAGNTQETTKANVVAENNTAADDTSTAEAVPAFEVVAIDRTSADIPVEVKKIVLRDAADTGQDITDLKADLNSVKNGMRQYNEKAEVARTLLEKITGG